MGMFDYLKVDSNLLPSISKSDKKRLSEKHFQSKSMECLLLLIEITKDAKLIYDNQEMNKSIDVFFYTTLDNDWLDFKASFKDGKLINIELLDRFDIRSK